MRTKLEPKIEGYPNIGANTLFNFPLSHTCSSSNYGNHMKWLHLDEWYCWGPCDPMDNKRDIVLRKSYPDQFARVPDELAARFTKVHDEFAALQREIAPYAGDDR